MEIEDSTAAATYSRRKPIRLAIRGRRKPPPLPPQTKWRSSVQEKIYSRRLVEALRSTAAVAAPSVNGRQSSSTRAVKEAADSALAVTAQGRTRWSRAILKRRWNVRKQPQLLLKKAAGGKAGGSECRGGSPAATRERKRKKGVMSGKNVKVRERLRALSRLVPGCRKASTPSLLEEAADYVAALELQVKAMRALVDTLSSAAAASSSSSSSSSAAAAAVAPPHT